MLNKFKPKSEFSRNVLTLMTGTTIAQAIPLAISPILTRLYTPEDFGIFALYMSIASILSVMATGRYELAIMLPKKDEDAITIVILSVLISFVISFISLLIIFIFNSQITELLGNPTISVWLYFIPLTVLLTGLYQSFNYWNNRKRQYKRLASNKIIQTGSTGVSNLSFGFTELGSKGLILGSLIGQSIATSFLGVKIWKEDKSLFHSVCKSKVLALMKRYKKMPMYNLPNAVIDNFRLSGINILIAKFFATSTLGQFSLAWKMVQMPMSIIGGSVSQVFFQKISQAKPNELTAIMKHYIIKASLIVLPIFLIIYFFAIDIFAIVFGESWQLAGQIASVLSPWLFLNFLSTPFSNVFIILHKQEIVLIVSIFYMLIPISILLLLHELNFIYLLNIITFTMCIVLILYIYIAFMYAKKGKN